MRVSAKGGPVELLLPNAQSAVRYLWPRRIPGTHDLTFTIAQQGHASIAVLRGNHPEILIQNGSHARYVSATGELIFQTEGHLLAVPFNPQGFRVEGEPYVVQSDVGDSDPLAGEYDISQAGTLVYLPPRRAALAWKTRDGATTLLPVRTRGLITYVKVAPDGHRAVVTVRRGAAHQLYLATLDGEVALTRLTAGDEDWFGIFTQDGGHLLFTSAGVDNRYNIYSMPVDKSGPTVRQTDSPNQQGATSIRRDVSGDTFLFTDVPSGSADVWQQQLGERTTARPLLNSSAREYWAVFSPDGRWIAYTSDVSGQDEIYVQRYPEGAKRVVSFDGGELSVWNQSGGELFYQRSSNVYAVRIVNGARVGTAAVLFQRPDTRDRNWDVAPDGRKFLVAEDIRPAQINIVQNWFEELKAKASGK